MTASNAESWARLRLVQGESSTKKWELTATQGNATLTIGTSADCTWIVRDDGVRPVHFSLHWDGQQLRIADVYSAGDVRVDGVTLSSQWRQLDGRVRIEFGKAAMVVETAIGSPIAEGEAARAEPAAEAKASTPPRSSSGKGTLIGVVPTPVPSYLQAPEPKSSSAPPEPQRELRKGPPPGSLKATLVGGIAVAQPPSGSGSAPPPAAGPRNKPNATLMGFSAADALRGVINTPSMPIGGSSSPSAPPSEITAGTVQGFPAIGAPPSSPPPSASSSIPAGRRMTQKGVISRPPGVLEGAVAHSPMRSISSHPQPDTPGARIGAAWQEVPEGDAILADGPSPDQPLPPPPRTARVSSSSWDIGERLSQLPTQMRDEAAFPTARRRRRPFPWRVVGVLLLTGVAYFAWLYLLDHW